MQTDFKKGILMDKNKLTEIWKTEEQNAKITGWDFSHINGKFYEDTSFPWDYKEAVKRYLKEGLSLLDIDTGGGEFLLSLNHPHKKCSATEAYPPNVSLCREKLLPLGIDFREGCAKKLPFDDDTFDIVINRHGDFDAGEIKRVLKHGGVFITQQVGAENDREFVELLYEKSLPLPFSEQYLEIAKEKFVAESFEIKEAFECKRPMRFYDTSALVWFANIIEWEFPDFSVERCLGGLFNAQRIIEEKGYVEAFTHRFFLVAKLCD